METIAGHAGRRRGATGKRAVWVAVVLVVAAAVLAMLAVLRHVRHPIPAPPEEKREAEPRPRSDFQSLVSPVAGVDLVRGEPAGIFQPTASGRIESALYGSTRTAALGKSFVASFHEGIDIASTARDARGLPADNVLAAADGTVRYVNASAGNSNYGIYVVLTHQDPLGECYTLYSHMARVESGIKPGREVKAGDILGRMGNTPSHIVPVSRAHLHFEVGLIQNIRFREWFLRVHKKPDHGMWHGWNLAGIDPVAVYRAAASDSAFTIACHIGSIATAFEVVAAAKKAPGYFGRYPSLWKGEAYAGAALVLSVSEGGVVLSGRNADDAELDALGKGKSAVLSVDEKALGRNGRRLILRRDGVWRLGNGGEEWLAIFFY